MTPTDAQLFGLHKFLVLLKSLNIYWFSISYWGDTITIKVDPPKGEIDLRIFKIDMEGRLDDDEFQNRLY